jgi:hypothetical protein
MPKLELPPPDKVGNTLGSASRCFIRWLKQVPKFVLASHVNSQDVALVPLYNQIYCAHVDSANGKVDLHRISRVTS